MCMTFYLNLKSEFSFIVLLERGQLLDQSEYSVLSGGIHPAIYPPIHQKSTLFSQVTGEIVGVYQLSTSYPPIWCISTIHPLSSDTVYIIFVDIRRPIRLQNSFLRAERVKISFRFPLWRQPVASHRKSFLLDYLF